MTGPDTEQPDATSVLLPGPWAHRDVSANGVRLHAAEAGDGPLVLLLHGFPQFWWAWRHQLTGLAAAGLRVVAPDLRGYGASDKPPRGYDLPTPAADAAAVIRALGETDAVVVGHDWGGLVGWTMAALHPRSVRRLSSLRRAHPRRLRASVTDAQQRRALAYALRFQLPRLPERRFTRADDDPVAAPDAPLGRPGVDRTPRLRRGRRPLPLGLPHPAGRVRRDGVLPLGGPVPAASRRAALRPPDGRADHRTHPAAARRARPPTCCPAPPAAPTATSPAPTSGASCPASATSRTRRPPTRSLPPSHAWAR